MIKFRLFSLCILYSICFILSVHPLFDLHIIKNHDFGMYSITQIIFCILITYLTTSSKACNTINHNRVYLLIIVGIGLSLRISSWWAPHYTTDLFRYLSDGLNILNSKNPYQTHTTGKNVAYSSLRTIYPLLTQVFFIMGALLDTCFHQAEKIYQIIFGMIEISFLFLLYKKLIFRKYFRNNFSSSAKKESIARSKLSKEVNHLDIKKSKLILFYFISLNPLAIFESHVEGHLEIFSVSLFIYATLLLHSRRYLSIIPSIMASFLSLLAKFHGLLLYPLILLGHLRMRNSFSSKIKQSALIWIILIGLASLASFIPFIFQFFDKSHSGMYQYFESWYFSSGLFSLLHYFLTDAKMIIQALQVLICSLSLLSLISWFLGHLSTHQFIMRCLFIFLFLFPVQHPWYFLLGFYGVLFSHKYSFFWMILMSCLGLNYLNYDKSITETMKIIISFLPWFLASGSYFAYRVFYEKSAYRDKPKKEFYIA